MNEIFDSVENHQRTIQGRVDGEPDNLQMQSLAPQMTCGSQSERLLYKGERSVGTLLQQASILTSLRVGERGTHVMRCGFLAKNVYPESDWSLRPNCQRTGTGGSGLPVKTTNVMQAMKEYILVFEGMLANVHSNRVAWLHHRSNVYNLF